MKNMHGLQEARFRKIEVIIKGKPTTILAELKTFFDPQKKFEIFRYATMRFALVKAGTSKVVLQDCSYICTVKNGMATYWDTKGQWGLLNERGQVICEAGEIKSSRKPSK